MAGSDAYARVVGRTLRAMLALGAIGAVWFGQRDGWKFGLGFALGAGLSYLSFWRWQRVVETLGEAPGSAAMAPMVIRFALLAGAAYGIINYLGVKPAAVFFGLLVAAAGVTVAILLELTVTQS